MVIRRRIRNILIPLALYAVSMPVSGYFLWHAVNGERGLNKRLAYQEQIQAQIRLSGQIAQEKKSLQRRIALFRARAVDHDILDEQARTVLGRVGSDDVVVFLNRTR